MMKRILAIAFCALAIGIFSAPAYAQKTKAALATELNANLPSGCTQCITAAIMRSTLTDIINSYMDFNGAGSFACAASNWLSSATTTSQTCTQPKWSDLANTTNVVTNANLSLELASSFKGNPATSLATPTDFTPGSLTQKVTPAGNDLVIIQDQSAGGQLKFATLAGLPSGSGNVTGPGSSKVNDVVIFSNTGGTGIADGNIAISSVASLTATEQTVSGGAYVMPANQAAGNYQVDCGLSPLQNIFNRGAFNITAPATDSSCILQVINAYNQTTVATPGAATLVNFSVKSPGGASFSASATTSTSVTISNGNPAVVTWNSNGLAADSPVYFTAAVPAGITTGQVYYIVPSSLTTNTFQIASTPTGTAIATTATGTNTSAVAPSVFDLSVTRIQGQTIGIWSQVQ